MLFTSSVLCIKYEYTPNYGGRYSFEDKNKNKIFEWMDFFSVHPQIHHQTLVYDYYTNPRVHPHTVVSTIPIINHVSVVHVIAGVPNYVNMIRVKVV